MRIFLTGEGPTDCGKDVYDTVSGHYIWEDGPVQVYLRKMVPEIEIVTYSKNNIRDRSAKRSLKRNQAFLRQLEGHGKKAFFVSQIAGEESPPFDMIAMYVDSDKGQGAAPKSPPECKKRYELIRDQVLKGLRMGGVDRPIAIVPMKMIECWILGDPEAFFRVYGIRPTQALLKDPELIWGDESNPASDYPKNRLTRVLAECAAGRNQETYVKLAEASDIDCLCDVCQISFADFRKQLRTICAQ